MAPTVLILDQSGIGPRIAEARKLRGLTQDGLAMRIPCSKSLISQVERGVKPATPQWTCVKVLRCHVVWRFVAHDGGEGLSPDGWLPDRISVGVLTRVFTPELVDAAVEDAGAQEQRVRLLAARLMVYFTLALWLFQGRNCGYGQVMTKLADGLYHQRRAADLLEGRLGPDGWVDGGNGRRWR